MENDLTQCKQMLTGCNWELTLACTLNCLHCGSCAGKARENELTLKECFSVADQLIALGCNDVTLIGGEVFLFAGWDRLSEYLTDRGCYVNIVTNGYNVGKSEVEQIKKARVINVGVSIDGMEMNHNRLRSRDDAFKRVKKTLELLNDEGININIVTTLTRANCDDLEGLYIFLAEHAVQVWQLQLANAMGNIAGKAEVLVTQDQVRQITNFIRSKSRDTRMIVLAADNIGYYDENETYIRGRSAPICCFTGCPAGISSVFIDSIGNVKGCGALYSDLFIEGNVRTTTLADIWNNKNAFIYNRGFTPEFLSGRCEGCEVGDVCMGGCRASNFFTTDSPYSNAFCCRRV